MKERFLLAALALAAAGAFARPPNYDESKVAPYVLEDPLTFADGRKLKDASEWPARRKEILEICSTTGCEIQVVPGIYQLVK
ncbi:MAG: hypothetical protein IJJ84_10620, partial [Kiritimatiellae bacterium]|nr:hypothetical protein [Kiritimatiellia bacterium]